MLGQRERPIKQVYKQWMNKFKHGTKVLKQSDGTLSREEREWIYGLCKDMKENVMIAFEIKAWGETANWIREISLA
jgi:hypothetical protein